MIIPIVAEDGGLVEWAMVELQGRIEPQLELKPGAPLPVGTLQLSPANPDVVQLQVGYHLIEGKRAPLKKPLAILEKRRRPGGGGGGGDGGGDGDAMAVDGPQRQQQQWRCAGGGGAEDGGGGAEEEEEEDGACEYEVVGVVRAKYLFKNRPKALISKPAGRAGAGGAG